MSLTCPIVNNQFLTWSPRRPWALSTRCKQVLYRKRQHWQGATHKRSSNQEWTPGLISNYDLHTTDKSLALMMECAGNFKVQEKWETPSERLLPTPLTLIMFDHIIALFSIPKWLSFMQEIKAKLLCILVPIPGSSLLSSCSPFKATGPFLQADTPFLLLHEPGHNSRKAIIFLHSNDCFLSLITLANSKLLEDKNHFLLSLYSQPRTQCMTPKINTL